VSTETDSLARRQIRFGWTALLVYATVGLCLETLHGFKVGGYLDVGNETRRLMWTLGHAHGVLLSGISIGFGVSVRVFPEAAPRLGRASVLLMAAAVLMPGGFLLGGVWIHGGDPGLGILLVPPGAVCLLAGLAMCARHLGRAPGPGSPGA
jgi:hypothetical protein